MIKYSNFIKGYVDEDTYLVLIFGSVARNKINHRDCDVLWVTTLHPKMHKWIDFKRSFEEMKINFYKKYNLKLNVVLYTLSEYLEKTDFQLRILNRPIIKIYSSL